MMTGRFAEGDSHVDGDANYSAVSLSSSPSSLHE
jgi:hypothetical protein